MDENHSDFIQRLRSFPHASIIYWRMVSCIRAAGQGWSRQMDVCLLLSCLLLLFSCTAAGNMSAEARADELLALTQDASSLNSSQVEQLVSQLEVLLSGPNVSLALGRTSVNIANNLLNASAAAVASSSTRLIRIVDTVGLKLEVAGETESILFDSLALAVSRVDGTNFRETTISIADPTDLQIVPRVKRSVSWVEGRAKPPQGSITLPSTLTQQLSPQQQQEASRLLFNFYQRSTFFQDSGLKSGRLNSGILSTSVANLSIRGLQDNVTITLKNNNPIPENSTLSCAFWDFTRNDGSGGWNADGCNVVNFTDEQTICSCSHLTSFGILLDQSFGENISRLHSPILSYISYIGCGISAIFLSITLLTYLSFGELRKDMQSKILIQLCFALLLLNLLSLLDGLWLAHYPDVVGLCISTAFFLHYFLLASFTWMGLEAVHMYIALVKVFYRHISHYILKFSLIGWGVPLIVVIIVIAIDKDNYGLVSYGKYDDGSTDKFCWLMNDIVFYGAVTAYTCVILLMNLVIFVEVQRANRGLLLDARRMAAITVLLGLTWGFQFFAWGPLNLAFMYLFNIFNTLQGFFIFVFHCAMKGNIRRLWRTFLCCGKLRLAENSPHTDGGPLQ
ncbi:LOW QUALITY PROTEIN: adhesion G-protein coupled receptor G2-like [Sardina pilchardus]|uniref:LOW QUALITY PROTEIN: adhesion G-protein coupled receptor G2-like n=1 Tax=Sardina pilchardus TaxID=27697 RepID=UPI002E1117E1